VEVVIPAAGRVPAARWATTKLAAPRALNEPVCCMNSSARCTPLPKTSGSAGVTVTGRVTPEMRSAADVTSSLVGGCTGFSLLSS
jgi:hypothetical protein